MFFRRLCVGATGPVLVAITMNHAAKADHVGYDQVRELQSSRGDVTCTHWHDWSPKTHASRYRMMSKDHNPFSADNDFAHVTCISQMDGPTLFRAPSPALTVISISPDG